MCLAIPMELVSIRGKTGIVRAGGIEKTIHLGLVEDLKIGDYVIVHAGFAIQKLDKEEAKKTLEIFKEINEIP